jgi:hypothetical protein
MSMIDPQVEVTEVEVDMVVAIEDVVTIKEPLYQEPMGCVCVRQVGPLCGVRSNPLPIKMYICSLT